MSTGTASGWVPPPAGIGPVVTAMATPFADDGKLDLDGAQRLADHLVTTGSDALVVHGTTGEAPTLRGEEPWDLLAAVRDAVGPRAKLVFGSGSNDTAHAVASTARATEAGVDGVLVVTPYYNRPDQRGLLHHFTEVARATDRPVILYDIAVRTGREIAVPTLVELAAIEHVVGVKDASGDVAKAADVLAATRGAPGGFALWSGADELNLPLLAVGGCGVISVSAHLVGDTLAEMVGAFGDDPARARELHLACMPLHRALFVEPSPAPLKGALGALGLPGGPVRPPLADASPQVVETVLAALREIQDAS